jgi:hypothetical protein
MVWCKKEVNGVWHYVYVSEDDVEILLIQGWEIKVDPPDKITRRYHE